MSPRRPRRLRSTARGRLPLAIASALLLGLALAWAWHARELPEGATRPSPTRKVGEKPSPGGKAARSGRATSGRARTAPSAVAAPPAGPGRVALVIDDLGRRLEDLETIAALEVPVAHAVLPFEPRARELAERVRARGAELALHLPMESAQEGEDPGPGALYLSMNDDELTAATARALAAVPGASGLNNHMGSRLTADRRAMRAVLGVAAARGLFFLDSRTTPDTVAFEVARELGVPALARQVFLDDDLDPAAIREQFERLLVVAGERGEAIAIGHPHPATFALLAERVPQARAAGVRFVTLGELLSPPPR